MRLDLGRVDPRLQWALAPAHMFAVGMQQCGLPAIDGEFEPRLVSADKLDINAGQQAAIDQRAMRLALGKVDAVALAQRIERAGRAGMAASRERKRVHHS